MDVLFKMIVGIPISAAMANPTKLLRTTARWWRCRTAVPSKTLRKPSFAAAAAGPRDSVINSTPSEIQILKQFPEDWRTRYLFSSLFAGLVGVATLETACADADQTVGSYAVPPVPSESSSGGVDLEDLAKKERSRIEELLKHKGMHNGSYPKFTVAVKGQKVTIKFQVPTACDISQLIASLVYNLGVKVEERGGGADMLLRGWDSPGAWQLTLNYPDRQKEVKGEPNVEENIVQGDLCVLIFRSHINSERAEIEFLKPRSLTAKELEAFASILSLAGEKLGHGRFLEKSPRDGNAAKATPAKAISSLESMGVIVYGLREPPTSAPSDDISWDNIAGYDKQKREIEDTILMALHSPQVYDEIARGTRCKFESNRPRAVLFEGPPGTGKTSCARVIASQAGVPLLYVPLEVVMSKYYGESERLLGQVFQLANQLQDGAIIFLDEVDSFAVARDNEMHEATRRILSVLLRQIDGFEQDKKVVVIAATNRKQDLDPALISRFDSIVEFGLPDQQNRKEIAAQYAKHLTDEQLLQFAALTEGMSGRDIRDVCQQAERMWASKIIRGGRRQANKEEKKVLCVVVDLPPLQEYMDSAANRKQSLRNIETEKHRAMSPPQNKYQPLPRHLN